MTGIPRTILTLALSLTALAIGVDRLNGQETNPAPGYPEAAPPQEQPILRELAAVVSPRRIGRLEIEPQERRAGRAQQRDQRDGGDSGHRQAVSTQPLPRGGSEGGARRRRDDPRSRFTPHSALRTRGSSHA